MSRERDHSHPTDAFGLPEGLLAAIVCALLLVGLFAVASSATPMPPAERWAALTTFTLLALGATLPGCAALYDALGRAVRRDWRAFAALAALIPALYAAYALTVGELTPSGLISAILFAAVPALAFGASRGSRAPTLLDGVGLGYLALAFAYRLLPLLALPQQGGLVLFFQFAAVPLMLLLYAWRGWPGLGFTWHLSWRELRDALLAAAAAILARALFEVVFGNGIFLAPGGGGRLFTAAVDAYFFAALPAELLLRGGIQNGLARALAARLGDAAPWAALGATAVIAALWSLATNNDLGGALYAALLGLAAGWTYLRTGKVTASAVTHALLLWTVAILIGRL